MAHADPTPRGYEDERVLLREYLEDKINGIWEGHQREHIQHVAAHEREHLMSQTAISKSEEASQKALDAALVSINERFAGVNEFRATLSDAASRFATRESLNALEKSLLERLDETGARQRERIETLERNAANMQGRFWMLGVALSFLVVLVQILVRFL